MPTNCLNKPWPSSDMISVYWVCGALFSFKMGSHHIAPVVLELNYVELCLTGELKVCTTMPTSGLSFN